MKGGFPVMAVALALTATSAAALPGAPSAPAAPDAQVERSYHRGQPHWRHVQPDYQPAPVYRCYWRRHWDGYGWRRVRVCG